MFSMKRAEDEIMKPSRPIPYPPKRAVVKHRRNGTLMAYDESAGRFYISNTHFTVFPSKAAASRAMREMCLRHEPDFYKTYDVYEYEE